MADNIVNVLIKAQADISSAKTSFNELKKLITGGQFSSDFSNQFTKDFSSFEKIADKYNSALSAFQSGDKSTKTLKELTDYSQQYEKSLEGLIQKYADLTQVDISKVINRDQFKQQEKDLKEYKDSLKQLKSDSKDLINNSDLGLSKDDKNSLLKSINAGDFKGVLDSLNQLKAQASQKVNEINNELSKIGSKDAIKSASNNLGNATELLNSISGLGQKPNEIKQRLYDQLKQATKGLEGNTDVGKLLSKVSALPTDNIENFRKAWEGVRNSINGINIDSIKALYSSDIKGKFFSEMKEAFSGPVGTEEIQNKFNNLWNSLSNDARTKLSGVKQALEEAFKSNNIDQIKTKYQEFFNEFSKLASGAEGLNQLNSQIDASKFDQLITTFQTTAQSGEDLKQKIEAINNALKAGDAEAVTKAFQDLIAIAPGLKDIAQSLLNDGSAAREMSGSIRQARSETEQLINRFARFTTLVGMFDIIKRSIRSAFDSVKELDSAMNSIAVVTNMTTKDLWGQIDAYTKVASSTGSTITGAYQVAQLYYQQGLQTADVTTMTTETLKLARIAGIDYAEATDYMTAALKGFALEYNEVNRVMDVYSNLAAHTAADTEEISIAMSKVASIAHSTGMSLENTAGFLTQIIATTREAPETAGTALKTVIARFAEVKELIQKGENVGTSEDGEEINVNKIEAGLKKVGVALRDTNGDMRNLDEVFIELSSKWQTLDSITQRYIATLAAGSRQQSRFLAFISDYEGLQQTLGYAYNSAGASQKQFEKTMDSLESKLNNLKNAWTTFTTSITNSDLIKGTVDFIANILNAINDFTSGLDGTSKSVANLIILLGSLKIAGAALSGLGKIFGLNIGTGGGGLLMTIGSGFLKLQKSGAGIPALLSKISEGFVKAGQAGVQGAGGLIGFGSALKSLLIGTAVGAALVLVTIAIGKIVEACDKAILTAKEAKEKYNDFSDALDDTKQKIDSAEKSISKINETQQEINGSNNQKSFEELAAGVDHLGQNVSLTSNEYERYLSLCDTVAAINPSIAEGFDSNAEACKNYTGDLNELLELQEKELRHQVRMDAIEATDSFFGNIGQAESQGNSLIKVYQDTQDAIERAQDRISENYQSGYITESKSAFSDFIDDKKIWKPILQKASLNPEDIFNSLGAGWDSGSINDTALFKNYDQIKAAIEELTDENLKGKLLSGLEVGVAKYKGQIEDANNTIASGTDKLKEMDEQWKEILDNALKATEAYETMDSMEKALAENWIPQNAPNLGDITDVNQMIVARSQVVEAAKMFNMDIDWSNVDLTGNINGETFSGNAQVVIDSFFEALANGDLSGADMIADTWFASLIEVFALKGQEFFDSLFGEGSFAILGENGAEYFVSIFEEMLGGVDITGLKEELANSLLLLFTSGETEDEGYNFYELIMGDPELEGESFKERILQVLSTMDPQTLVASQSWGAFQWDKYLNSRGLTKVGESIKKTNKAISKSFKATYEERAKSAFERAGDAAKKITDVTFEDLKTQVDESGKVLDKTSKTVTDMASNYDDISKEMAASGIQFDLTGDQLAALRIEYMTTGLSVESLCAAWGAASGASSEQVAAATEAVQALGPITAGNIDAAAAAWGNTMAQNGEDPTPIVEAKKAELEAILMNNDKGSGGGGGGGGGGGDNKPKYGKQDHFFNYIKTKEANDNKLDILKEEQEVLLDPDLLRQNLEAQVEYFEQAAGSTQSYLDSVNSHLQILQRDALAHYSEYFDIVEDGTLRLKQAYFFATDEKVEELDEWIDFYEDLLGRQQDLTGELQDYQKELKNLWEEWRDEYISVINELSKILKETDEKALDEKEEYYEKLEKMSDDYLDAVRDNIEEERRIRDMNEDYEEIEKQQRRLALLERDTSGRYDSEIAELREEIEKSQQGIGDSQVDKLLDELEKQLEQDEKRHEEILNMMQKQIDENQETRYYIQEAEAIIKQGDDAILEALMSGEDYQQASDAERDQMYDDWRVSIGQMTEYMDTVDKGIRDAAEYLAYVFASTTYTNAADAEQLVGVLRRQFEHRSIDHFAEGGIVDYTGPAWVDGTKSSPEAFLDSYQTSLFADLAQKLERTNGFTRNDEFSDIIGNYTFNISIGNLGIDYDIEEAIEKVKEEITEAVDYRSVNILQRGR